MAKDDKGPHPVLFAVIMVPFGLTTGYVGVTLGYLLSHAGVSTAAISGIVALTIATGTWQILWSPLIDTLFTYRLWCAAAMIMLGLLFSISGVIPISPASVPIFSGFVLCLGLCSSPLGVAATGLIARTASPETKGKAGGWSQAGNLGGNGLGGGAGLWLATHGGPGIAGLVIGAACLVSATALFAFNEPAHAHRDGRYLKTLKGLGGEIWGMLRERTGFMACFLMILPLGTGAASGLFSVVAKEWRASADIVALITGTVGGLVSIPGCLIGGYLADRIDRKTAYLISGALSAGCAVALAMAGRAPIDYIIFTTLYTFASGVIWGAFGGVVFEAAATGSAATKGSLIGSLANVPITVMIAFDGRVQTAHGTVAMLLTEAAVATGAIVFFIMVRTVTTPKSTATIRAG